jgi:hypothetical protein
VGQVVVDRLGHADDAQLVTSFHGFFVNFVRGVLGIVATDVEKIADAVRRENLEEPVHVLGRRFRMRLEVDFVTAGPQGGRGRVFQPLDRAGVEFVEVDEVLVQDAEDAVEAAVNLLDASGVFAHALDDTSQACVDHRRGSARLSD